MKNLFLLIVAFLIIQPFTYAQNNTSIGLEFGPKFEMYKSIDYGGYVFTFPFLSMPVIGICVEQEFNISEQNDYKMAFETGLRLVDYYESYRIKTIRQYSMSNAIFVYQIPIKLKIKIPLPENNISLNPAFGLSLNYNSDNTSSGGGGVYFEDEVDKIIATDTSNYSLKKTYLLFEFGLSLNFKLKNDLELYCSGSYYLGSSRVIDIDVFYTVNSSYMYKADVFSNGDYFSFVFGLKYPISNIWLRGTN